MPAMTPVSCASSDATAAAAGAAGQACMGAVLLISPCAHMRALWCVCGRLRAVWATTRRALQQGLRAEHAWAQCF